jgi:hypothetical protein
MLTRWDSNQEQETETPPPPPTVLISPLVKNQLDHQLYPELAILA